MTKSRNSANGQTRYSPRRVRGETKTSRAGVSVSCSAAFFITLAEERRPPAGDLWRGAAPFSTLPPARRRFCGAMHMTYPYLEPRAEYDVAHYEASGRLGRFAEQIDRLYLGVGLQHKSI